MTGTANDIAAVKRVVCLTKSRVGPVQTATRIAQRIHRGDVRDTVGRHRCFCDEHPPAAFDADPDRIVLFGSWDESGDNCDKEAVKISGTCVRIDGVVYGPFGKVRLSGEHGHDYVNPACAGGMYPHTLYSCGVVSWAIELSGNLNVLRSGQRGSFDLLIDE